jgi:signal transduction histidine kinase/DNA-binding response OmpR family regulator/HAMP domain-containing protein
MGVRAPLRLWVPGLLLAGGIAVQLVLLQVESSRGAARVVRTALDEATLIGTLTSARIDAAYRRGSTGDLVGLLGLLAAEPRVQRAALADARGTILVATEIAIEGKTLVEAGFGRAQGAIVRALATDRLQGDALRDPPVLVVASPVRLPVELGQLPRLGVLVAEHELARPLALARFDAVHRALWQGALFLGASLGLYLLIHLVLLRRLARLAAASERLASGDYGARAELGGRDELSVLGHAFDRMASDIEARDRAVRDQARRIEGLLANLNDAVLVVDDGGGVRYATGGVDRALPGAAAGMLGAPATALIAPHDRERLAEALARSRAAPDTTVALELAAARGGARPEFVEVRIVTPADPSAVGGSVVTVRDVTERRRLHGELELRQKMELVSQLSGGVAHDFNNVLSVIMLSAEAALAALPPDSAQRDLVREIHNAAVRGGALTRQLLNVGRRDLTATGPTDVNAVIGELEPLLRRLMPSNVEVVLELAAAACWIRGNQGLIEQVVVNLVVNARDAMPSGGRLHIRTRHDPGDADGGERVTLEVEDTGAGIDPAIRDRIFEPLMTTKAPGHGTGLGLTTVQSIVADLGGEVSVDSTLGKGSRFRIALPALAAPASQPRATAPGVQTTGSETVLYVEDDAPIRAAVERALRAYGYRVIACGSAEEALQRLGELGGEVNVLATDVRLPGIDGLELWRRAAHITPGLPVLFMSGYAELSMRAELVRGGFTILPKPLDGRRVAEALRGVIARGHEVGLTAPERANVQRMTAPVAPAVLLVDDDVLVRRTLEAIFADNGYRPRLAVDGDDAVEKFRQQAGELAAVVLDLAMPRKHGLQVLAELAAIDRSVPVIAISGFCSEDIERALAEGRLAGFVPKPFTADFLLAAVAAAVGRRPPSRSSPA